MLEAVEHFVPDAKIGQSERRTGLAVAVDPMGDTQFRCFEV
jgi:hypothetical protein